MTSVVHEEKPLVVYLFFVVGQIELFVQKTE